MQIGFNQNMNIYPSFKAIDYDESLASYLRNNLNTKDIKKFISIVDEQKYNQVNIRFFVDNNKLSANIYNPDDYVKMKQAKQGLFQSPIGFIASCARKANRMEKKVDEKQEIANLLDQIG